MKLKLFFIASLILSIGLTGCARNNGNNNVNNDKVAYRNQNGMSPTRVDYTDRPGTRGTNNVNPLAPDRDNDGILGDNRNNNAILDNDNIDNRRNNTDNLGGRTNTNTSDGRSTPNNIDGRTNVNNLDGRTIPNNLDGRTNINNLDGGTNNANNNTNGRTNTNNVNNNNNGRANDNGAQSRTTVANQAAKKIADLPEVDNANVIVTNNNAFVAVQLPGNKSLTNKVQKKITNQVKAVNPNIDNVYVSANPDFVRNMQGYANDIRNGRLGAGFFNQFNQMLRQVFPNVR